MVLISSNPVYNAIIFYVLFVIIILLIKPNFMYCDKNKKFKSFGLSEGRSLVCFPIVCVTMAIILYLIFLVVDILCCYLDK